MQPQFIFQIFISKENVRISQTIDVDAIIIATK